MASSEDVKSPLVGKTLVGVAAFLAAALPFVAPFLPTVAGIALGPVATILAFVFAALAGLALPQVAFAAHKPLLPVVAVPLVASLVPVLMQVASAMSGMWSALVQALAMVLAFAAGLASPAPVKVAPKALSKAEVVLELGK